MSSYWNYRECCEPETVCGGTPDDEEMPVSNPQPAPHKSYNVTIRREPKFSCHGDCWVARNDRGEWITYGSYMSGMAGREIVEYLFHACEIASVGVSPSGDVTAMIYGG